MATRKVKRYNGEDDSDVSSFAGTPENESNAGMKEAADAGESEARGEAILKGMRDSAAESKPASKPAASKPAASKPAAKSTQYGASAKSLGSSLRFGSDKRTTHPEYPEDYKKPTASKPAETKPAGKKEMYRGFDGKMHEKTSDTDSFKGVRESISSGLKSAGEGISKYVKSLGQREEKHGTYVKDGKVVKYAKGGSTASKRADGIASRGKTRGKIC